ncbi:MAG: TonB-dependent receptor, partial [Candidatus Margulisiibacteriota bacterium]
MKDLVVVPILKKATPGRFQISQKDTARLADSSGIFDAMTSLQMLPGVGSNGGLDATMYIRGGEGYQLVSFLDKTPIYRPYFWGGGVSLFNSRLVKTVDFFPGGFGVEYGQSLSGIIDVKLRDGDMYQPHSELDISSLEANYFNSVPIEEGKSALWIDYRRTFYDLLAPFYINSEQPVQMPFLQTLQIKYSAQPNARNKLWLDLAYFNDGMKVPADMLADNGNSSGYSNYNIQRLLAGFGWETVISTQLQNALLLSFGQDEGGYFRGGEYRNEEKFSLKPMTLSSDLTYIMNRAHVLKLGFNWHQEKYQEEVAGNDINYGAIVSAYQAKIALSAFYLEDNWQISDKYRLTSGLRLDNSAIGDHPGSSILQPRISLISDLADQTRLRVYAGKYVQSVFLADRDLNGNYSLADLKPETAVHYGLGLEKYLARDVLLKAEVFYKEYRSLAYGSWAGLAYVN